MSIKHTSTTIGTKPLAAIVAEFRATIKPTQARKPSGPGWLEAIELRTKLRMGETAFSHLAKKQVDTGVWLREIGTKPGSSGIMRSTVYYRVAPHPAQPAPKQKQRATGGA